MIQIHIENSRDMVGIWMRGHAGYAPVGSDIVCAACTILTYVLANGIYNADAEDKLHEAPTVSMTPGDIAVYCRPKDGYLSVLVQALEDTCHLLRGTYPENIEIIPYIPA